MGLIERGGELRAGVVENVRIETLEPVVYHHVMQGAVVVTDEHRSYMRLSDGFRHYTVNHRHGEYVRGDAHTNSIESVWALLKRQIIGIHHWVSPKHLDAYVSEMTFRFNRRDEKPSERMNDMLGQIEGPLPYKVLTA
jgi:transposase-like protein